MERSLLGLNITDKFDIFRAMKTLLALLLFMPTILFAKNQIIYCYDINDKFQRIYNSDSINYFEIDDKKKRLDEFKIYYDDYGISKFYFSGEDWVLEFDDPNKEIEIIKFDESHISYKLNYPKESLDKKGLIERYIMFIDLDRIAGIMTKQSGIKIDDNGDMYVFNQNSKDQKFYFKDDEDAFWQSTYITKHQCEKSKEL